MPNGSLTITAPVGEVFTISACSGVMPGLHWVQTSPDPIYVQPNALDFLWDDQVARVELRSGIPMLVVAGIEIARKGDLNPMQGTWTEERLEAAAATINRRTRKR